jgi:hypothetical protein
MSYMIMEKLQSKRLKNKTKYIFLSIIISIFMANYKILPFSIFYAFDILLLPFAFFFMLESFPYRTWKYKIYTISVLLLYSLYFITQSDILSVSNEPKIINITNNTFIIYLIPNLLFYFFLFSHINYWNYLINSRKQKN